MGNNMNKVCKSYIRALTCVVMETALLSFRLNVVINYAL